MTPLPGWYPDPSGAAGQRYWDGVEWGPTAPAAPAPKGRFGTRQFVILAIAGAVAGLVTFIPMQLLFGVGGPVFEVLGFLAFAAWICSGVATIVGIVGALLRSTR
jgi:hypothetical protein